MRKEIILKALPWLLIIAGLYALTLLPAIIGGACMVIGITMLLNRIWPEKWGEEAN